MRYSFIHSNLFKQIYVYLFLLGILKWEIFQPALSTASASDKAITTPTSLHIFFMKNLLHEQSLFMIAACSLAIKGSEVAAKFIHHSFEQNG